MLHRTSNDIFPVVAPVAQSVGTGRPNGLAAMLAMDAVAIPAFNVHRDFEHALHGLLGDRPRPDALEQQRSPTTLDDDAFVIYLSKLRDDAKMEGAYLLAIRL